MPGAVNLLKQWRADVASARSDLHATRLQASLVAVSALAWRVSALLLPVALIAALVMVVRGDAGPVTILLAAALAALGPQLLVLLLMLPATFVSVAQSWYQHPQDARVRFGGLGGIGCNYYGWRYAYRGRTRPWGALSPAEKASADPARAGLGAINGERGRAGR